MSSFREYEREARTVGGVTVVLVELVWGDGGRSWDVRTLAGEDLTVDGSFDTWPTDDEIRAVLPGARQPADIWTCPGCGAVFQDAPDLVVDHVRYHCDRVDGAGDVLPAGPGVTR